MVSPIDSDDVVVFIVTSEVPRTCKKEGAESCGLGTRESWRCCIYNDGGFSSESAIPQI